MKLEDLSAIVLKDGLGKNVKIKSVSAEVHLAKIMASALTYFWIISVFVPVELMENIAKLPLKGVLDHPV